MSKLQFEGGGLPDDVIVAAFRGEEGISTVYRFELWLVAGLDDCLNLDLDGCIGASASLLIKAAEKDTDSHAYRGIIHEIELLQAAAGGALFRAVLVPELFKLSHSMHSRVYTNMTVDKVVEDVCQRAGIRAPTFVTQEEHPEEEFILQLRESDLDFISRWLEREGYHYYFKHDGSEEELVITDSQSGAPELPALRYSGGAAGDASSGASLTSFGMLGSAQAADVMVRDYDYANPSLGVEGSGNTSDVGGEIVKHEERCFDPGDAQRLADIRNQALTVNRTLFAGRGTVFGVRPGYKFSLEEYPRDALNQAYLVTKVEHRGSESAALPSQLAELLEEDLPKGYTFPDGYQVDIVCTLASLPYRSLPLMPWPRIYGYRLGVVDGPGGGDYAQLDDAGRYLVKLNLDESELSGATVSTRMRMMQPHTGSPEGWHFPLRAGTEVVVQFLGGDPDRPFIAGAVPNTDTPSPVTEANNTQNVLQTGGETRLEIEDDAGKQYIWLYTPPKETYLNLGHPTLASHNITLHTKANALYDIGSNQVIEVGGHLDEQVQSDVTETYMAKQTSTIEGPQSTKVNKSVSEIYLSTQKTTVKGSERKETFNNGHTTVAVGARSETYKAAQEQKVDGTTNEIWVGNWMRKSGETKETYDGDRLDVVLGPVIQMCPSGITEKYGDTMGLYMSKTWIGGSREYNAPNTTEINLVKHTIKGEVKDIKNIISGWDATSIGATGFTLESIGIAIEIVPSLKLSVHGVLIGLYPLNGTMTGLDLHLTVFQVGAIGAWAVT